MAVRTHTQSRPVLLAGRAGFQGLPYEVWVGAPGETRTHDLLVRNQMLYPLSYGRHEKMAEREGFEPSKQVTPLTGLANRRTRPLCDLSSSADRW